jgi:glycosyltransferase involved in cell wall biosynthesis
LDALSRQQLAAQESPLTGTRASGVDLQAEARAEGVSSLVRDLGWVPSEQMPLLYDGAVCLLFPTLFEGFGIPIVEAMRRGTPVVAGEAGSAPEVSGGHALLVDPQRPEAIADAIHEVLDRPEEARRRAERASDWVERYSWERSAGDALQILRSAAAPIAKVATVAHTSPRVFVVTPSYNQARYLRATIDSVLEQEYPHLDYFVADGGSTDGSVEILRSYGDRVRWVSAPDGGQSAAIASAWRDSNADLLAWLNSDDVYLPGAISAAVDHLLAHPDASMVYGRGHLIDEQGVTIGRYPTVPFDAELLRNECFVCQPATLIRSEVFRLIDYPDPDLRYAMDYDLWIRLAERFAVSLLDHPLAGSRVHADTKTLRDREQVFDEIVQVAERRFGSVSRNWSVGALLHRTRRMVDRRFGFLPEPTRVRMRAALARRLEARLVGPLYPDRWAGTASWVEVRADDSWRASLTAESPFWPYRKPPALSVEVAGETIAHAEGNGSDPIRLDFTLPPGTGIDNGRANVLLRASRTFVPKAAGWAAWDERPISVLVRG